MTLNICICGTMQSGSTRLFNLVRLIYKTKNKTVISGHKYDVMNNNNKYDVIISKVHSTSDEYLKDFDIILLPLRNILDAAISKNKRIRTPYKKSCHENILLFNKYKVISHFIFKYEKYSIFYIHELCKILDIKLNNNEIIQIMKQLNEMLNSKNIVKSDYKKDTKYKTDKEYKKTLLTQSHNTSGGLSNKFINDINIIELNELLNDPIINSFLKEHKYI
jgi:hypothetical protein